MRRNIFSRSEEYDEGYRDGAEEAFDDLDSAKDLEKLIKSVAKFVGSSPYYKQKLIDAIEYYLKMKVVG